MTPDQVEPADSALASSHQGPRSKGFVLVVGIAILGLCLLAALGLGVFGALRILGNVGETYFGARTATHAAQLGETASAQAQEARATGTHEARQAETATAIHEAQVAETATAQAREANTATVQAREAGATATLESLQSTAEARSEWRSIQLEPFETNEANWETGLTEDNDVRLERFIGDGVYRWEASIKQTFARFSILEGQTLEEFFLAVSIRRVSGPENSNAGLIFRTGDTGYYLFAVGGTGQFSFWLIDSGEVTPIIDWSASEFVAQTGYNRLEVSVEDDWFLLFINNHFVARIQETRRSAGTVGLMLQGYEAGEEIVYVFDDFELRVP
jgi:hypothetical protein